MYLFEDQQTFRDFIVDTSERFKVKEEIVEKDYFVSIVLRAISQKNPNIIFKGGTSLSKAYQIIDRFSEDIDLSYYIPTHSTPNNKSRKRLKDDILNALKDFGFEVTNETEIFSRRSFNKYLVNYSPLYNDGSGLKQELWVETYCHNSSFPVTKKSISN